MGYGGRFARSRMMGGDDDGVCVFVTLVLGFVAARHDEARQREDQQAD